METIFFIIHGNQEDPTGNPIPYHRVTGRGLWLPAAKRYAAWKDYVRKTYLAAVAGAGILSAREIVNLKYSKEKPIVLKKDQLAEMNLKIYWKDNSHGDPDNIFKGINDSLFKNDKNVYGSFEPGESNGKGRVEATIKF